MSHGIKLKHLQSLLEGFEGPPQPNIELEQYATPSRLAAQTIFQAEQDFHDIEGKVIADLGCGCGILSIAALIMGAKQVHAYDLDPLSIEAAKRNLDKLEWEEPPQIFFYEQDVTKLSGITVDTVLMNPPFGTRNKGKDIEFLQIASQISKGGIYSFHKTSTRHHVIDIAAPKLSLKGEVLFEVDFDLKKLYKFHKQNVKAIKVDILHFSHIDNSKASIPQRNSIIST